MNENLHIDLSLYRNKLGWKNKLARLLWNCTYPILFRLVPSTYLMPWRKWLLTLFGAKLGRGAQVSCSARIWAPWNLEMSEFSCLAPEVDCYNVNKVSVGAHTTISQKTYLCTASHDITDPAHPLITAPIHVEDQAWIAADAFIGMGVTIGQGAVVGARAAVFKDVAAWTIVGGNPAKFLKSRTLAQHIPNTDHHVITRGKN